MSRMPVLGWWRRTRRWWLERNTHGRPTQDKVFVRPAFGRSDSAGAHDARALSRTSSTGSNDSKQGVFAGSSFAQGEVWERARRREALQLPSGAVTERTERGHRLAHNDSFARSPGAERSREAKLESLHELLRATSVESVTRDTSASRLTRGRSNFRRVESDPQFRQESLHAEPVASSRRDGRRSFRFKPSAPPPAASPSAVRVLSRASSADSRAMSCSDGLSPTSSADRFLRACSATSSVSGSSRAGASAGRKKTVKSARRLFEKFDTDSSDGWQLEQVRAFLAMLRNKDGIGDAQSTFHQMVQMDAAGSGKVTFDGFCRWYLANFDALEFKTRRSRKPKPAAEESYDRSRDDLPVPQRRTQPQRALPEETAPAFVRRESLDDRELSPAVERRKEHADSDALGQDGVGLHPPSLPAGRSAQAVNQRTKVLDDGLSPGAHSFKDRDTLWRAPSVEKLTLRKVPSVERLVGNVSKSMREMVVGLMGGEAEAPTDVEALRLMQSNQKKRRDAFARRHGHEPTLVDIRSDAAWEAERVECLRLELKIAASDAEKAARRKEQFRARHQTQQAAGVEQARDSAADD